MSNEITGGIVKRITSKETKFGTLYSLLLQEDDGSENWYGWGKYAPKFGEGSEVEFEVTYNGQYANAVAKTVDVIQLVEAAPQRSRGGQRGGGRGEQQQSNGGGRRSSRGGNSTGGNNSFTLTDAAPVEKKPAVDWDRKDKIIQWQSCRNSAIAVLELALKADALPLPAKKAEKLDALVGAVNELTEQFFKENNESPFQEDKTKRAPKRAEPQPEEGFDDIPFDSDDEDDGLPGDE